MYKRQTVEGASFLEDDAAAEGRLDALAEAGVRMVTLTWNGRNALGSGNDTADGLTGFGRSCVRELEPVSYTHLDVYKRQVLQCQPGDILEYSPEE